MAFYFVRGFITITVIYYKSIVFYLCINIPYQSVYIFGTQVITIGKHIFSNSIQQGFIICPIICYIYGGITVPYSYFFQFISISEIHITMLIPISYIHTTLRQFQLFNIMHIHEIAITSMCSKFILAQFEIFDVLTYLRPSCKFISLQYFFLCTFFSSFLIGKYNTINSILIYLIIIIGFSGQFIFFNALPIPITFILYLPSIKKCSQSVRIFICLCTIDYLVFDSVYLNIFRPISWVTILIGKPDFEVISVR